MPDPSQFKTEIVSVRMSPDELRAIRQRAHDCGKCLSTYMRIVAPSAAFLEFDPAASSRRPSTS